MNPYDWRYSTQRLQTHLEPDHQRVISSSSSMGRVPRIAGDWEIHPMHTAVQPHSRIVSCRELTPPSQNFPDPDGKPLNLEEEDPELARKKRELQVLHEQIINKKATIAIKAIEMIVKNPSETDAPDDDELETCRPETLRDRVREILQQRSFSFFSKVKLSKLREQSAALRKDGVKQQHHPLKLRVKALRAHRLGDPCVLPPHRKKVPDVPLPHPDHIITCPAKQESTTSKGYERLLGVLKKVAAAAPNMNSKVPDVPLLPPDHGITSPDKQQSATNKRYERLLSVLSKGAAPSLNTAVHPVEFFFHKATFVELLMPQ
ncbi:hypothetical protein XENORESO_007494 [Xenotaenia resolanae]|uniref:Uncharacterized protein n=1 Tax=Xenotaenia resolanae TaxID=208358 RepID=A0ABV0WMD5_9TELE